MLIKNLSIAIVAIFLVGCSFKPVTPRLNTSYTPTTYEKINIKNEWWKDFNDEILNSLVENALKNNSDLALALNNIDISRVKLGLQKLDYLPNLGYTGSALKKNNTPIKPDSNPQNVFNIGGVLNYEIDFWGRVRNSVNASKSLYKASIYEYETAKLSLISEVVNRYFQLIFLHEQEQILKESLKSYEDTLNYRKNQLNAGIISSIVYAQTKGLVDSANSKLVDVESSIDNINSALAILTGESYNDILYKNIIVTNSLQKKIPEIPSNISSDILLRRADVASALEKLKASNFLVGVAKANYFPIFSITGALGYTSFEFDKLFIKHNDDWNIGGSIVGPLLDFGRVKKGVELANLEQNANFINYDRAIKNAFLDVRTALTLRENSIKKQKSMRSLESSQHKVYELANDRYNTGYSDHIELLDAQRNYLDAKLGLAASNLDVVKSVILVYKAFGGGFKVEDNDTEGLLMSNKNIFPEK